MDILELERYRIIAGNDFYRRLYESRKSTFNKPVYISVVTGACTHKLLVTRLTRLNEPGGTLCFGGLDKSGSRIDGRYDYATNSGYIINGLAKKEAAAMIMGGPQESGLLESFVGDGSNAKEKTGRAYVRFTLDNGGFYDVKISSLEGSKIHIGGRRYKDAKWYRFGVESRDSATRIELNGIYFPPLQLGFIENQSN